MTELCCSASISSNSCKVISLVRAARQQEVCYGLLPATRVISSGPAFVTKDTAAAVVELVKQGVR